VDELVPFDARCVVGTLSGFDRVRLRGTVSLLMSVGGMLAFLSQVSVWLKDFGSYAEQVTTRLRKSLEQRTLELGRKVRDLPGFTAKEELVAKIRREEGVGREGLIAVLLQFVGPELRVVWRTPPLTEVLVGSGKNA